MFSQTTEYALRVVAYLAGLPNVPATTRQMAAAVRIPESYLAKVLQLLSRAGLISSQRGLHGGSTLARPAEDITLYDVVQAIDPIPRIKTCPLGLKSHGTQLCPVHKRLDHTMDLVEQELRRSTLADLLAEPSTSKPLCEAAFVEPGKSAPVALTVSRKK